MPTAEVFFLFLFPLGLGLFASGSPPPLPTHYSWNWFWTHLGKEPWVTSPQAVAPRTFPTNHRLRAKELCATYWPTEYRFNRQERLQMINCSYLYLWVWIFSMPGLSPFYFIIFPLLETEEQKSIAWVLASHWNHAFQFQLKTHSGWADVIHQTPVG